MNSYIIIANEIGNSFNRNIGHIIIEREVTSKYRISLHKFFTGERFLIIEL